MATEYIVQALTTMQPCPVPTHWTAERQRALKPILLLSTFDAIERGIVSDNFVPFNAAMHERFNDWWSLATHMQEHIANFHLAFFHLADEPFWVLVDAQRFPVAVQPHSPSPGDGFDHRVAGAMLDSSLVALVRDQQCRRSLMADIIASQFPVHSPAFGRLWTRLQDLCAQEGREASSPNQDEESAPADIAESMDTEVTSRTASGQDSIALQEPHAASSAMHNEDLDATDEAKAQHEHQQDVETTGNVRHECLLSLSLLPSRCVEALEGGGYDWRTIPLKTVVPDNGILKMARSCGLHTLGDLWNPSPLSLLALATPLEVQLVMSRGFWVTACEVARETLAEVMEATVRELLRQIVPVPSFGLERARSRSDSTDRRHARERTSHEGNQLSALFFSLEDIMKSFPVYVPDSNRVARVSTPAGERSIATDGVDLWRLPLLSASVQVALSTLGCPLVETSLAALSLPVRTANSLHRAGIYSVSQLVDQTPEDLFGMRNVGSKSYNDVVTQLRTYLDPWLSRLPLDLLVPTAPPSAGAPNPDADGGELATYPMPTHDQSAGYESPGQMPLTALFQWLDESRLPTLLTAAGTDWRELRLSEVLGPATEWGDEQHLLDMTLSGYLQLSVIAATFDSRNVEAARKLAADLREGLIRRAVARLLAGQDSLPDGELACGDTLDTLFDILTGPTMADLRPRELQVFSARLGLRDGPPATLAEIGERTGVTRERVRQLDMKAHGKLADEPVRPFTRALGDLVRCAVLADGGAATIASAADRIASWLPFGNLHPETTIRLLATWSPATILVNREVLVASPYTEEAFDRAQSAIQQVLGTRHGISHNDLIAEVLVAGGDLVIAAGPAFVAAVLRTMPDVAAHGGIYQPARRGAIQARIVQAMRSLGCPTHFTEIAAKYRKLFPDDAARKDNSIHAFFDRFPETFVLVGNGTFALAEWGYDPAINSVPTLVEHILEQSERPLHVDEVIEQASVRYRWKSISISAQLTTNPRIRPFGNGFFGLRDHHYSPFDTAEAYADVFGESTQNRERLVVGSYTNGRTHRVVQVRLTPATMSGAIPVVSRPLREILPTESTFLAECWYEGKVSSLLTIVRSRYDLHGLSPFFGQSGAHVGDYLFIEQLAVPSREDATVVYRLALATPENVNAARQVVGLGPERMDTLDADVLHYTRNPERVMTLITHALAHPWAAATEANAVLGYAPSSPYGADYLRLAQAGAMLASGTLAGHEAMVIRPTYLGRRWVARATETLSSGRLLALSLPAYRQHLRSIAAPDEEERTPGGTMRLLGDAVTTAWDTAYAIERPAEAHEALATTSCLLSTSSLDTASLTRLVLLLLAAQSHGQGIALRELANQHLEMSDFTTNRLRALGIAVTVDDADHSAFAERVNLAVVSGNVVAGCLAESASALSAALADAWPAVQRDALPGRAVFASDFYAALELRAPDLLHALLVPPPSRISERIRFHDAELFPAGFVALAADWGVTAHPGDQPPFAFLRHADALARKQPVDPVAICLSRELLAQTWDAPRHLAANAHLALLVLLAGDLGDLADQIISGDAGWSIAGEPLLRRLDTVLRSLGYDVWDDLYRDTPALQTAQAEELVAFGVRLGLLETFGNRIEAAGSLAAAVYYSGYDVLTRVRAALALPI